MIFIIHCLGKTTHRWTHHRFPKENLKSFFNLINPYSYTSPSEDHCSLRGLISFWTQANPIKEFLFFYKPHDLPLKGEKRENDCWERHWLSNWKLRVWVFWYLTSLYELNMTSFFLSHHYSVLIAFTSSNFL